MACTNTLAYLTKVSETKKKVYDSNIIIMQFSYLSLTLGQNMLEPFALASFFL
jgi:hypothetical protein